MDKNKNMVILSIKSNILFEIVLVLNEKKKIFWIICE